MTTFATNGTLPANVFTTIKATDLNDNNLAPDIYSEATAYTIKFIVNGRGGTVDPNSKSIHNGEAFGDLPAPSRPGYAFVGWYISPTSDEMKISSDNIFGFYSNIALYAHWLGDDYGVRFNANYPDASAIDGKTVCNGTAYGELPAPARTGYMFAGWFTDSVGGTKITADTNCSLIKDQILYAHWTPIDYLICFNANYEGGVVEPALQTFAFGSTYGTLPSPTRIGYSLSGWFTAPESGAEISAIDAVAATNQMFYAHWAGNTYMVSFNPNGGSGTEMADEKFIYGSAKELIENTYTLSGYVFHSWNTKPDGSGVSYADKASVLNLTTGNPVTLYAQWDRSSAPVVTGYTIKTSPSPYDGGTVTGDGTFTAGSTVTLKATANTGYTFTGWYDAGKVLGTDASLIITVTGNRTITAFFRLSSSSRIAESNRYGTMAEAVKKAFPDGCDTAILVSGTNWPDALAASSLSGAEGCPVILTKPGELVSQTADTLAFLKPKSVILVGGPVSVSDDVKAAVEAKGIETNRIYGKNRTQTADSIEAEVMKQSRTDTVVVCSGQNFPDAVSISAYAYAKKIPILLTGNDGKLTDESLAIAKTFKKAILVGNKDSLSGDVETQLSGLSVKRYGGDSRYDTSVKIINDLYGGYAPSLAIATGRDFPDALAAAALVGQDGGAILLVDGTGTALTADQKMLIGNAGSVSILGNDETVSSAMKTAIDNALK